MTTFNMNDVRSEITGRAASTSDAALGLVSSIAIAFMVGVHWADNPADKMTPKGVVEMLEQLPAFEVKSKSGRNGYIALGKAFASHLVKQFGNGAGSDLNAFWAIVRGAETIAEQVDWLLVHVRSDLECSTYADLAARLSPDKPAPAQKSFSERVLAMVEKDDTIAPAEIAAVIEALQLHLVALNEQTSIIEHSAVVTGAMERLGRIEAAA